MVSQKTTFSAICRTSGYNHHSLISFLSFFHLSRISSSLQEIVHHDIHSTGACVVYRQIMLSTGWLSGDGLI